MRRKFELGDMLINHKSNTVYIYVKVSSEFDNIEYRYILQSLDGVGFYDAWINKECADRDLFDAFVRGELDHCNDWSIMMREEQVVKTEMLFNRDELGFKGGE